MSGFVNNIDWGALQPQWVNLIYSATPGDTSFTYQKTNGDITSGVSGMSISYLASQNGNNGAAAHGFVKGTAPGMFHIAFTLGYQWGFSSMYAADVKAIGPHNTLSGSVYQTSGYNGLAFVNNNSNNVLEIRKHINTTTTLMTDTTGMVEATRYDIYRQSDNAVYFRVQGSNPVSCGTMAGEWCFYHYAQSPCKAGLISAVNIARAAS